jgi:ribonuclease VapC
VELIAFDHTLLPIARFAFDRYGKGRHKAALNFGDCMSYAVAKARTVPLLYKGQDFQHTDIESALP